MSLHWKDVGVAVAKFAPLVGGVVGGPIGAGVGEVGSLIAKAFGCDNTPDAVLAAVQKDPEAGVKLAQIEADNKVRLAQIAADQAVQRLHEEVADRGSARQMRQATGDYTPDILTGMILLAFIGMAWGILSGWATGPLANTAIAGFAGMLIRDIGHALQMALKFWFGGGGTDDQEDKA